MVSVTKKMKAEKSRHTFALTRTAVLLSFLYLFGLIFRSAWQNSYFPKNASHQGIFLSTGNIPSCCDSVGAVAGITSLAVVIVWVLLQG